MRMDGYDRAQARKAADHVDGGRQWRRLMEMSAFGGFGDGGVNRAAFSSQDIAARARLLEWAATLELEPGVDAIGNLTLRLPGADAGAPPVMTGSHMDSQPQGGRFDGIYGVIAGLEALQAIRDSGLLPRHPIEVVAWSNEEGGRFSPGAMGSAVFAGAMRLEDCLTVTDAEGISLETALAETLAATPTLPRLPLGRPVQAYLEAHIEQGPLLEAEGLPVGVVDGVQGSRWFEVTIRGEAAHAGTTPLSRRKDALRSALAAITALHELIAEAGDTIRFTVGRMDVHPNSPNTVPQQVLFSIDLRHPDAALLTRLGDGVRGCVEMASAPCTAEVRETFNRLPCRFDAGLVTLLDGLADDLSLAHTRLPSGAFHDAVFLAEHCPTAMIFVPCVRGVSHNPAELASEDDLAAGTRLLTAGLVALAT